MPPFLDTQNIVLLFFVWCCPTRIVTLTKVSQGSFKGNSSRCQLLLLVVDHLGIQRPQNYRPTRTALLDRLQCLMIMLNPDSSLTFRNEVKTVTRIILIHAQNQLRLTRGTILSATTQLQRSKLLAFARADRAVGRGLVVPGALKGGLRCQEHPRTSR